MQKAKLIETDLGLGIQLTEADVPWVLNFDTGKNWHRLNFAGGAGKHLASAVGAKRGERPNVIDATAGLGTDAFMLAGLGCKVTLIEREPLIFKLLSDALERAKTKSELIEIIDRMHWVHGDAINLIPTLESADVIYFDPMFPPRTKTAKVKKPVQILQAVCHETTDILPLFSLAVQFAGKRVVVKRPIDAGPLTMQIPSYCVSGKTCRWDVYLV